MSAGIPKAQEPHWILPMMGYLAILGFVFFWVTMSEVSESFTRSKYNKPGFNVWVSHIGLTILIPVAGLSFDWEKQGLLALYRSHFGPLKRQAGLFLLVALLYFACMYTWMLAFEFTTCSSSSALYQTAGGFTLLFSVPILGERLHWRKLVAVAVSLAGVVVAVWPLLFDDKAAQDQEPNPSLGDSLTVVSAAFCGLYNVAYKILTAKEEFQYGHGHPKAILSLGDSVVRTLLCLGGLGLAFIPCGLILIAFHVTGLETFELPADRDDILPMIANAAIMPFYDFSFAMALQINTAIMTGFAMGFVVPSSFFADWLIHNMPIPVESLFGAAVIAIGLAMMSASYDSDAPSSDKLTALLEGDDEEFPVLEPNVCKCSLFSKYFRLSA
eukprot:TRINITY_DN71359_c0_g1_i1.p1 TRINITY_DN71359_c0_g1~~TRINITY_DN71359_c0_g1_i1.p1  ORF type:complete len:385 (-),score=57.07 TRINITY_DN71359_c0_g1_i1:8-1162(-)